MALWTLVDNLGDRRWRAGSKRDEIGRLIVTFATYEGGILDSDSELVVASGNQPDADVIIRDWLAERLPAAPTVDE